MAIAIFVQFFFKDVPPGSAELYIIRDARGTRRLRRRGSGFGAPKSYTRVIRFHDRVDNPGGFPMNKGELIEAVAQNTGESKATAEKMVNETLDVIVAGVVGTGKVSITGFGTFEARDRAARTARNPQTGAEIQVKATRVPAFKAGKAFKDAVKPG
jgi:DNA-binding protein HU-beta